MKDTKTVIKVKKRKKVHKKLAVGYITIMLTLSNILSVSAAPPAGADTAAYNALTDVVFWVAGIAIAAAGGIPSIIKIVQGQADEDPRGRNAGIAGAVITGACVAALAVVRNVLF